MCSECNETITKKTCGHARKCMYCEKAICKSCKRKCQNETWIKAKKKMWIHIECQKRMHRELTCVDCNTLSKNLGTIRQCVLCGDSYCKKHKKKHMEKTGAKTYVNLKFFSAHFDLERSSNELTHKNNTGSVAQIRGFTSKRANPYEMRFKSMSM